MNSSSSLACVVRRNVLDRDDQRRVADDPRLAVDDLGELGERLHAVLRPRLGDVALEPLHLLGRSPARRSCAAISSTSRRAYQRSRLPHRRRNRASPRGRRVPTARLTPVRCLSSKPRSRPATAKLATSRLTSHSNGPGQRLVEVVDAEDEPPVGRGEGAEVREVRVAAQLHLQPGSRRAGEIGRHQVRGAAVERERRDEHPPVADRHELRDTRLRLLLEQVDRIAAERRRLPLGVHLARNVGTGCLSPGCPLGSGEVLDLAVRDSRGNVASGPPASSRYQPCPYLLLLSSPAAMVASPTIAPLWTV